MIFIVLGIFVLQKEQKNTKELEGHFHKTTVGLEDDSSTEGGGDNNGKPGTDTGSNSEIPFQLMHPFSYAYRSFVADLNKKNKIKLEYKKKLLKIKAEEKHKKKISRLRENDGPENRKESVIGYISAVIAFLLCIGLVCFLSIQNGIAGATRVIQGITKHILGVTEILTAATDPLTNFLISCGVLFLFVILILTLFLLIYTSLRVVVYLLSHTDEDTERVHRIGKAIKAIFLGILDGALRPLLFLPDFIECLENMLLETDMNQRIDEMYPTDKDSTEQENAKRRVKTKIKIWINK